MSSERQPVEATGRWWGEHIHRYNVALGFIQTNDIVLDIACGTGFGTDMIAAKTSGKVIGGDIAAEAVEECKGRWNKPKTEQDLNIPIIILIKLFLLKQLSIPGSIKRWQQSLSEY